MVNLSLDVVCFLVSLASHSFCVSQLKDYLYSFPRFGGLEDLSVSTYSLLSQLLGQSKGKPLASHLIFHEAGSLTHSTFIRTTVCQGARTDNLKMNQIVSVSRSSLAFGELDISHVSHKTFYSCY